MFKINKRSLFSHCALLPCELTGRGCPSRKINGVEDGRTVNGRVAFLVLSMAFWVYVLAQEISM